MEYLRSFYKWAKMANNATTAEELKEIKRNAQQDNDMEETGLKILLEMIDNNLILAGN